MEQPAHTTCETIALLPFRLTSYVNSSACLTISSTDTGGLVKVTPMPNETGHFRSCIRLFGSEQELVETQ
jgi:hypothetical protein